MAIPLDLRLDHSGRHYRKHSSPPADQIARTALVVDAASCHWPRVLFSSCRAASGDLPCAITPARARDTATLAVSTAGHPASKTTVQAGSLHDETGTDACITKSPLARSGKCS